MIDRFKKKWNSSLTNNFFQLVIVKQIRHFPADDNTIDILQEVLINYLIIWDKKNCRNILRASVKKTFFQILTKVLDIIACRNIYLP